MWASGLVLQLLCSAFPRWATAEGEEEGREVFRVLRLRPESQAQLALLRHLHAHAADLHLDFWQPATGLSRDAHVMVDPEGLPALLASLSRANLTHSTMIDDVEALIQKREHPLPSQRSSPRRLFSDAVPGAGYQTPFNLATFHSYPDILQFLRQLQHRYPGHVNTFSIGLSHEMRPLQLVKIGSRRGGAAGERKPSIWVDGGIHAREWVAPATALYFIHQLASGYDSDPTIRSLVDNLDWYILPVVNPDGYEFSRSSTNPRVRLWRKNRSPAQCRRSFNFFSGQRCCRGVDLNRNFDFHFGGEGSSADPCEEIYKGAAAFSEPETRAIRDFVTRPGMNFQAFITMHSYSQIWMYPYGHRRRQYPPDVGDLKRVALKARAALQSLYGTKYQVGTGADTLYPASGGSDDWAKDSAGIKFVYLLELRPEDHVWDGFILDQREILPTARETWEGVKVVAREVQRRAGLLSVQGNGVAQPTALPLAPVPGRPAELCRDELDNCVQWAQHNGCQVWKGLSQTCRKSCGLCRPSAQSAAPANLVSAVSASLGARLDPVRPASSLLASHSHRLHPTPSPSLPSFSFPGPSSPAAPAEDRLQCANKRRDCYTWLQMGLCSWVRNSCRLHCLPACQRPQGRSQSTRVRPSPFPSPL